LIKGIAAYVKAAYPDLAQSPDYTAIVNERQYQRLTELIGDAESKGAAIHRLGTGDPARRLLAPPSLPTPAMTWR
jgi:coniferyl-aldehyde dehydrogenase